MAEKKPMIVIKKITVVQGGGHGGAWKVAFADFMTAMMAFFLVMWLISSASEAEKKAISDYFSTPSVIEYQFQNYGAELTLEKLFLDLVNEPLKTLSTLTEPADRTPNVLHLGTKKIVMSYMADQLGNMASDVSVTADSVVFEVPDNLLFRQGSADPALQFVNVMERVKGVTQGLEDSQVIITSVVYRESVKSGELVVAKNISEQRFDLLADKVKGALENDSVVVTGKGIAKDDDRSAKHTHTGGGFVRFEIRQNVSQGDGKKARAIVGGSEKGGDDQAEYESYVNQITKAKGREPQSVKKAKRRASRPAREEESAQ